MSECCLAWIADEQSVGAHDGGARIGRVEQREERAIVGAEEADGRPVEGSARLLARHVHRVSEANWCNGWVVEKRGAVGLAQLAVDVEGDERVGAAEAAQCGDGAAQLLSIGVARI